MDIYKEVFKCGILKMRLREADLTVLALEKYKAFCHKIVHDNPLSTAASLCTTANLGLRFFIEFPEKNLSPASYIVINQA